MFAVSGGPEMRRPKVVARAEGKHLIFTNFYQV
jgi:hypothetical protein